MRAYPEQFRLKVIALAHEVGLIEASKRMKVSPQSVIGWCKPLGISFRKISDESICKTCGKTFKHWRGSKRLHCSKTCWSKAHRIAKICPTCQTCFHVTKVNAQRKYCSHPCYAKSTITNDPSPKRRGANWRVARRECIKRHQGECLICIAKASQVHHVIPFRYFYGDYKKANHQSNLVLLCVPCHQKADKISRYTMKAVS